jgi:mRNA interferase RelE/StbE
VKTLVFAPAAARQFDALPPTAQAAIEQALARYSIEGYGDVKRLIGREGYRMRVGEYRVIFDETQTTILALRIGRRNTNTYS